MSQWWEGDNKQEQSTIQLLPILDTWLGSGNCRGLINLKIASVVLNCIAPNYVVDIKIQNQVSLEVWSDFASICLDDWCAESGVLSSLQWHDNTVIIFWIFVSWLTRLMSGPQTFTFYLSNTKYKRLQLWSTKGISWMLNLSKITCLLVLHYTMPSKIICLKCSCSKFNCLFFCAPSMF